MDSTAEAAGSSADILDFLDLERHGVAGAVGLGNSLGMLGMLGEQTCGLVCYRFLPHPLSGHHQLSIFF
jgi:hypothetical protein